MRSSAENSGALTTMPCCESERPRAAKIACKLRASSLAFAYFSGIKRISGANARSSRSANATKRSANATASGEPITVIALIPFSANTRSLVGSNVTSESTLSADVASTAAPSWTTTGATSLAIVTASARNFAPPPCASTACKASAMRDAPALRSG